MAEELNTEQTTGLSEEQKESLRIDGMNGVRFKTSCKNAGVRNDKTAKKYWDDGVTKGKKAEELKEVD